MRSSASRANTSGTASQRVEKNSWPGVSTRKRPASASASASTSASASASGNASGTASQRAEKSARLCQQLPHQVGVVSVNIGTGNLGLHQNQIESEGFQKGGRILWKFQSIVAKCVEEGELHKLNLCEVGGHKQGLAAIHCDASNIVDGALKANQYGSRAEQAYLSVWAEAGASQ